MGGAEAANLVVTLSLRDQLTPGLAKATASIRSIPRGIGRISSALGTMGSQLKNVISGPVGLIGLGGALFGLERFLSTSVSKATAFGEAVAKIGAITRATAQDTSKLVDTLDYFGIAAENQTRLVAMAEKNLGNLTKTSKTAAKFAKEYGLSLTTAKGKVKDFNTLLLQSADYFNNKAVPAQKKAAALAKIYGRNWAELIPVFTQGSAKLKESMANAIRLSDADLANMQKFKEASREWDDALGDLQVTVGAKLLPTLTRLARSASKFVSENQQNIAKFFEKAASAAEKLGKTIQETVVPIFSTLASAWAKVPDDLKKVLIGAYVVNKVSGGLLGKVAGGAIGAAGKGVGSLLGMRGSSPASPVFVSDVAGAAGAAGGIGKLGKAFLIAEVAAGAIAVIATQQQVSAASTAQAQGISATSSDFLKGQTNVAALQNALAGINQGIHDLEFNPLNVIVQGDALEELRKMRSATEAQIQAAGSRGDSSNTFGFAKPFQDAADAAAQDARETQTLAEVSRMYARQVFMEFHQRAALWAKERGLLHGRNRIQALRSGGTSKGDAVTIADTIASKFEHATSPWYHSSLNANRALNALRSLQARFIASGDTKTAARIGRDISTLRGAIAHMKPPKVNVSVVTNTTVSVREFQRGTTTWVKYGGRVVS